MGFLVLAALSSGTMPDGCRFLVSVCIAASASAMNTTSWPIGSWTFGWSELGLLIPTALFHESGRFSGVKPLSWLALERGNTQARTYSLESDPPESPALLGFQSLKQSSKKAVRRLGADGTQKDENTTIDGHCHFDFQFCAAAIGIRPGENSYPCRPTPFNPFLRAPH
jgi:hypothetical protein